LSFNASAVACSDTVIVQRSALDAGLDITLCGNETRVLLNPAEPGQSWTADTDNPSPAIISPSGEVTGLINEGIYVFTLTNGQCTSTVRVTKTERPTFTALVKQNTCNGLTAANNGQIILTSFFTSDKIDIVEGSSYNGNKTYETAAWIPGDGIVSSNLANPAAPRPFTIRIFNSAGCFHDSTVVLTPTNCTLGGRNGGQSISNPIAQSSRKTSEASSIIEPPPPSPPPSISVFPNPTKRLTTVQVELNEETDVIVYVHDASGRALFSETHRGHTGRNEIVIDLDKHPPGLYLFMIELNKVQEVKRVIKEGF
jgi:hypothetical protein